ncbi:hypothetical protein, partial [Klebsiella variicola]|uniref:hypothetical protein n=1 Tax=Klebsiella variicola TaxID=244366 RepID=UPI001A9C87F0
FSLIISWLFNSSETERFLSLILFLEIKKCFQKLFYCCGSFNSADSQRERILLLPYLVTTVLLLQMHADDRPSR